MGGDRFPFPLICPTCGQTGVAKLWQEDGWSFSNGDQNAYIEALSGGFRADDAESRPGSIIVCVKCNVAAREMCKV
jgi:hypothetical protein